MIVNERNEGNEENCFRPWTNYLICDTTLPDTPKWEGTLWQEYLDSAWRNEFSFMVTQDGIIYKINSESSVENVSKLMSWGEIESFGFNNKMRPIFRASWIEKNLDQYIQWFSPVGYGMEMFSMLDGFGPDGKTTLPLLPFPMLKTTEDMFTPYTLTVEDMMAKDWIIAGHTLSEVRDEVVERLKNIGARLMKVEDIFSKDCNLCDDCDEKNTCEEYLSTLKDENRGEQEEPNESKVKSSKENGLYEELTWSVNSSEQNIISSSFKDFKGFQNWFTLDLTMDGYLIKHFILGTDKPVNEFECLDTNDLEDMVKFIEFKTFDEIMPLNVGIRLNITHQEAHNMFRGIINDIPSFGLLDRLNNRIKEDANKARDLAMDLGIVIGKNNFKSKKPETIITWEKVRNRAVIGKEFTNKHGQVMNVTIEKVIRNRRVDPNTFMIKLFGAFNGRSNASSVIRKITVRDNFFDETILKLQKDINKDYVKSEKIRLDMNIKKLRTLIG